MIMHRYTEIFTLRHNLPNLDQMSLLRDVGLSSPLINLSTGTDEILRDEFVYNVFVARQNKSKF
jgi:hypothetical protein